ncbi:Anoctamin-6 [Amphibalanus amphitrite]|uniref:Anoctamin-6 n=1 Tax=Amphibalanus amphitrite TaxID=1232801 RepID=A0A6A4X0E4_AMPAM|nr:Anoctamin-6 [Amphibalanus amphitrite]KAF0307913.1 Anoctamin-6 [Amphibalanus amphitrite]
MPEEEEGLEEGDQTAAAADSSDQVPLLDPSPSPLDVRRSSSVTPRRSSLLVRSLRSIASFRKKRRSQPVEQRGSITGWLQRKLSGQRQGSVEDLATFAFDPASSGDNQNNEYHIERRKDAQLPAEIDSCFFRDGKRRIDYILVYEDTTIQGKVRGRLAEKRFLKQEAWRGRFRANLRKAGLQMEEEIVPGPKKTIYFIKLHAPWDVLCTWAEELKMRAPLQPLFHMVRERITPRKSIGPQYLDGFLDSVTRMNVEDQLQMSATQMSPKMELFIARIVSGQYRGRPGLQIAWLGENIERELSESVPTRLTNTPIRNRWCSSQIPSEMQFTLCCAAFERNRKSNTVPMLD